VGGRGSSFLQCSSGSDDSAELVVPYHATPPVMILAGSGRIPDELSVRSAAYTEHADTVR
jgi:hypothetical protein